jgi:hypothetical protein
VWFPWRSGRNTVDLYLTSTQITRLGGGLTHQALSVQLSNTDELNAAIQTLLKPLRSKASIRAWLGAALLHAGVLAPVTSQLNNKDLEMLVAAELAELTDTMQGWSIATRQQIDRSILWSALQSDVLTGLRRAVSTSGHRFASAAPLWTIAHQKTLSTQDESLLWWIEVDAVTGISAKDGLVLELALLMTPDGAVSEALERLRVRLACNEHTNERAVSLSMAFKPTLDQDVSAQLLPSAWVGLGKSRSESTV